MKDLVILSLIKIINTDKDIRHLLIEGEVEETIEYINEKFPGFLENNKEAMKTLRVQLFIEHIKAKDIQKALECAQKYLIEFKNHSIHCIGELGIPKQVIIDVKDILSFSVKC